MAKITGGSMECETGDRVVSAATAAPIAGKAAWSIAVWVKWLSGTTDSTSNLIVQANLIQLYFAANIGSVRLIRFDSEGESSSFNGAAGALEIGKWHLIVVTYDGTNIQFFVDGVEDANSPFSDPDVTLGTPVGQTLHCGLNADAGHAVRLTHPAMWDKALDANEIASLVSGDDPLDVGNPVWAPPINGTSGNVAQSDAELDDRVGSFHLDQNIIGTPVWSPDAPDVIETVTTDWRTATSASVALSGSEWTPTTTIVDDLSVIDGSIVITTQAESGSSRELRLNGFGHLVPANATIQSIELQIRWGSSGSFTVQSALLRAPETLDTNWIPVGTAVPVGLTTQTYASKSQVEARNIPTLELRLRVVTDSVDATIIDYIATRVTYIPPAPVSSNPVMAAVAAMRSRRRRRQQRYM